MTLVKPAPRTPDSAPLALHRLLAFPVSTVAMRGNQHRPRGIPGCGAGHPTSRSFLCQTPQTMGPRHPSRVAVPGSLLGRHASRSACLPASCWRQHCRVLPCEPTAGRACPDRLATRCRAAEPCTEHVTEASTAQHATDNEADANAMATPSTTDGCVGPALMALTEQPRYGQGSDSVLETPRASTRRDCLLQLVFGTVTAFGSGAQLAPPATAAPFCEVAGPVIPPWVYSTPWNEDFLPNQVWYREVGDKRKAAKAGRLPVLVVHGGPGLPHSYLEPLELLAVDRCVYFYDQSGSGYSGSDEPHHVTPQAKPSKKKKLLPRGKLSEPEPEAVAEAPGGLTVQAFAQELADVRVALGLQDVHIVAHGWGTVLALEHALSREGAGIASLTLSSAVSSYATLIAERRQRLASLPPGVSKLLADADDDPSLRSSPEYGAAESAYESAFICRTLQGSTNLECLVQAEQARGEAVFDALCGGKRFQVAGNLQGWDVGARLKELNVPTLVTCGDSDEICEATARTFSSQIPNAQLNVFERSGSCSHIDAGQAYLEALAEFLNTNDAKKA